jgi:outer membrane protein OmpA-like peptidoglycan-associated protein
MDIYYTITSNGEYAYYSSGKTYFGKNDLYRVKLPKVLQPEPVFISNPQILANSKVTAPQAPPPPSADGGIAQQPNTTVQPVVAQAPQPPKGGNTVAASQTNAQTNDLQRKLDSLKNLAANPQPVASATVPAANPVTPTPPPPQQPAVQTQKPATQPAVPKKDTLVNRNALPQSATMELPKQPNKYAVDSFKNIPKVENNDPQKQVFDNLKKQAPNYSQSPAGNQTPNSDYAAVNQANQLPNMNNQPMQSAKNVQPVYANVQIESNPQQFPTGNNQQQEALKPREEINADPYAEKLAQLKQQQSDSKFNQPVTKTTDYSQYTQKKDYANPTIDRSNNIDPQKNAMEQKLQDLNTPNYEQSTRLSAYDAPKNNQPLKERQEDVFAQQNNDMQDKIAQLKQQQQQLQPTTAKAPRASEIKVDNTNPDIKYVPKTSAETVSAEPNPQVLKYQEKLKQIQDKMNNIAGDNVAPQQPKLPATEDNTPAQLKPAETAAADAIQGKIDALKEAQKKMETPPTASLQSPASVTHSDNRNTKPAYNNIITENEPNIGIIPSSADGATYQPVNNMTDEDFEKQKKAIDDLKKEQDQLNQQLNSTLSSLNENKTNLEKDIGDLAKERDKVSQQLNSTLSNLNQNKNVLEKDIDKLAQEKDKLSGEKSQLENATDELAKEKAKLEADKKAMDELLAQMQAEKDRLAQEKDKMERDKELLEKLRKQQEKEVAALSKNIDSLKKAQQQAIDANSKLQRYEVLEMPIEEGAIAVMKSIYFMADASFIQNKSYPELDKLAAFLKQNPKIQKIEIGGHTNGLCDDSFCDKLSDNRAKSVVDYLVSKGIDPNILTYKGYGKQFLISKPGDAINQRVEVKILSVK